MAKDNNHIISLIEERLEKGKREYNQEVDVHDGRDWMTRSIGRTIRCLCIFISTDNKSKRKERE